MDGGRGAAWGGVEGEKWPLGTRCRGEARETVPQQGDGDHDLVGKGRGVRIETKFGAGSGWGFAFLGALFERGWG